MGSGFLHGVKEQRLTAEQLAEAVAQLPIIGSGRIEVFGGRGGTAIGFRPGPVLITDVRPAVVTNHGPRKADADYDDERYWTQAIRPAGGRQTANIDIKPDKESYPDDWWVPASNLDEWNDGTHALPTDGSTLVIVFRLVDTQGNERFVFSRAYIPATFPARLSTATQDGTNKRWAYDYAEVEKTGAGYGQWTAKAAGRSGTAYNRIEDMNGAAGVAGTGVNLSTLPAGFDLVPAPSGVVVQMEMVPRADDATQDPEAWFSFENAVDGTCGGA